MKSPQRTNITLLLGIVSLASFVLGLNIGKRQRPSETPDVAHPELSFATPQLAPKFEKFTTSDAKLSRIPATESPNSYVAMLVKRDADATSVANTWLADRGQRYTNLFLQLGLSPQQIDQVMEQLAISFKIRVMHEQAALDIHRTRNQFTNFLQKALSDDAKFSEYLSFEANRHSYEETDNIVSHSTTLGTALAPKTVAALQQSILKTHAYAGDHGPLDPIIVPAYGAEGVRKSAEAQRDRVSSSARALLEELESVSEPERQAVASYFTQKLNELDRSLQFFAGSEDEVIRRVEQEIEEMKSAQQPKR